MQSLKDFHFSPEKSGHILKKWVKDSGMSYHRVAEETGIPYDTLVNSLSGRVQELSLERAFKIAVCTGHSTCEYIKLMLQDEDIDFMDRVHVLRDVPMERALFVDHPEDCCASYPADCAESPKPRKEKHDSPQAVTVTAPVGADLEDRERIMDRLRGVHDRYTERLVEQYKDQIQQLKDSRQITIDHYEDRVKLLDEQHSRHIQDIKDSNDATIKSMEESHQRSVDYLKAESARLRKWVIRLAVILGLESTVVLGVFAFDALNRNVGWFRSMMPYVSNGFWDSLWS